MATIFNVNEIVTMALRRIGSIGPHDVPDPASFTIGMKVLDMLVAEIVETEKPLWLIPEAVDVTLSPATQPFDFVQAAGSDIPTGRFANPITVSIVADSTGVVTPLTKMSLREYQALSDAEQPGFPSAVYIDRTELRPKFYFDSVIQVTGYTLRVVFYLLNEPIAVNGSHGFPQAWQRFLTYALAADLGSGPVLHIEEQKIDSFRQVAEDSRRKLFARKNRPYARPQRVRFRDY